MCANLILFQSPATPCHRMVGREQPHTGDHLRQVSFSVKVMQVLAFIADLVVSLRAALALQLRLLLQSGRIIRELNRYVIHVINTHKNCITIYIHTYLVTFYHCKVLMNALESRTFLINCSSSYMHMCSLIQTYVHILAFKHMCSHMHTLSHALADHHCYKYCIIKPPSVLFCVRALFASCIYS